MDTNITINKPSGNEVYKLISAYKNNNEDFLIVDSKLKDANQNTIVFVSKINGSNLEVIEGEEWKNTMGTLISIVKGQASVEYIKPELQYAASENVGHLLALKDEHIEIVKKSYDVKEKEVSFDAEPKVEEPIADIQVQPEVQPEIQQDIKEPESIEKPIAGDPIVVEEPVVPAEPIIQNNLEAAINNVDMSNLNPLNNIEDVKPEEPVISEPIIIDNAPLAPESVIAENTPVVEDVTNIQPVMENPVDIQPVITENPNVISQESSVLSEEPSNIFATPAQEDKKDVQPVAEGTMFVDIDKALNDFKEALYAKEAELNKREAELNRRESVIKEKEENIDAKLVVANQAFENAQALNQNNMNAVPIVEEPGMSLNLNKIA